jgi:lipopolysaccharide transport system permease protein
VTSVASDGTSVLEQGSERGLGGVGVTREELLRRSRRRSIRQTWQIAFQLARLDILRRYTATLLGVVWAALSPLLMACVIGVVFSQLFGASTREFLPHLFISLTLWNFFLACVEGGAISFLAAEGYIKQIPSVSLWAYPLRMVLAALFTLLVTLAVVSVIVAALRGDFGIAWLLLIPGLAAWMAFGLFVACLTGLLNTAVRDVQYVQSVAVQILFYATPVIYPEKLLVEQGLSWALTFNPVHHLLALVRIPMMHDTIPPVNHYIGVALTLLVLGGISLYATQKASKRIVFWL